MKRTLMIVGAHADDVELNAGGTALKFRDRGYEIVYVQSTNNMSGAWSRRHSDGSVTVDHPPSTVIQPQRKLEACNGAAALGTTPIHLDHPQRHYRDEAGRPIELRYGSPVPPGVAEDVPTILTAHESADCVREVAELIRRSDPEYVLTHGMDQNDMEHVGTALLVTKAFWEAVKGGYGGGMAHWRQGFDWLGAANARWDTFIDIGDHLDRRQELAALHECQLPNVLRPTSPDRLRALAWGSACGCRAAEVYVLVREPTTMGQYPDFSLEMAVHKR